MRSGQRNPAVLALLALIVGTALGIVASQMGSGDAAVRWIAPVGQIWVNAIRMTVIPLVVAALIVAVAETNARAMGRIGTRALIVFLALLGVIAAMTSVLAPMLFAGLQLDATAADAVRGGVATNTVLPTLPSFSSWLVSLVPSNPLAAAADGAMLPLVIFTLAFGLALGRVEHTRRDAVVGVFRGISDAVSVLVAWILRLAPLGVFALAFVVAARIGSDIVGAAGYYVVAYSALLIVATLMVYAAVLMFARRPFVQFVRAVLPAQLVAVTTRSSMAALPAMVAGAEATLALPKTATSFALPLAVSTFRLNQAVSWVAMALFAAKLYGVELESSTVVTLATTSVLMSFSVPGIPSASLFVVAPFFTSIGIPAEAIGVLIALDLVPDVFKTLLNVTGQLGAVTVIGSREETSGPA